MNGRRCESLEPCILDGDDGFGREVLDELDLLFREGQNFLAADCDRTHEVAAKQSTPRAATDHGSARKFIGDP